MPDSHSPVSPDHCPDCANFIIGEPPHLRLRPVCPSCRIPLCLHDRYEIARKLSDSFEANAEVYVVFDNQETHVQKVLKVLINQKPHVLSMFKVEQTILMELDHPGIPKGYEAFDVPTGTENNISCVVMEKISGETLQDYLNHHGPIDQETAIDWMRQLTNILGYVHSQKLFHRDVKLTNIMRRDDNGKLVLIDFGTSRHITQTIVNGGQNTVVFSYGYTAPEQLGGKAEARSDFYALGRTFLHLLMGELPSEWKTFSAKHQISNSLIKLLKDLTEDDVNKRPRTAKVLLNRLKKISHEPKTRKLKNMAWVFAGGMLCGSIIMTPLLKKIEWETLFQEMIPRPTCDLVIGDKISCGEEELIQSIQENTSNPDQKGDGTKQMIKGDYKAAFELFKTAFERSNAKDPETLIYKNNARINMTPELKNNKVTIVAVAPIGLPEAKGRAISILRGIAQAQENAIDTFQLGLEVIIVDDKNNRDQARSLAENFTKRKQILGGVGHASSEALIASINVYEARQMVFVAAASTSEQLSSYALKKGHIFFRSLPSNRINALYMNRLVSKDLKQEKVALYYSSGSSYSVSLASSFREVADVYGLTVVNDGDEKNVKDSHFDISGGNFNAKKSLQYAKNKGATVHILIPDASIKEASGVSPGVQNSTDLVRENCGTDWIVAADSLAGSPEYLKPDIVDCTKERMLFSAAWDPSADYQSELLRFWQDPKSSELSPVDWRTFTSYKATWILATALKDDRERTRDSLRKILSSPTFEAQIKNEKVRFREESGELANSLITTSMIQYCGNRYVTVNFKTRTCPPNSAPKTP
jgi:eukaryotic-like serine/threonine-protein kinase